MKRILYAIAFGSLIMLVSCSETDTEQVENESADANKVIFEVENFIAKSENITKNENSVDFSKVGSNIDFEIDIPTAGRYKVSIYAKSNAEKSILWIEDYIGNKDDRTYNITGNLAFANNGTEDFVEMSIDGSPLNKGIHPMSLHLTEGNVSVDKIEFELIRKHQRTPRVMEQNMEGDSLELVWSDEFEGTGEPDTSKWTYDVGNWGWGNNELQYYTVKKTENARLENGNLIIEARKDDMGYPWTSARLTTRGKVTFLYGRMEFRAKVPPYRGNWAAGWTLGDEYVDEKSWPYCGEIDILESVGYEMDDNTGKGQAHASIHCRAYYFKIGNQKTGIVDVDSMYQNYHIYAIDWSPEGIVASVDGREYLKYEDTSSPLSWPFDKPQNIILNLAIGGGWGGQQGIDETVSSQKMILDYVRVYGKK
ncbi:glycoside hydrolase family 16 protein [Hyphobacterium sp. CCMP332]|nr:glycoside hydrolase family 16 protein [Hyphobacterium sp. CCMP332]